MSDSSQSHGLQYSRLPCPSPTPEPYSNSCALSWWYPTISSSVVTVASHLQSFPSSESFQRSQLFASGGQSVGVSAATSVLPMNTQDGSALGWTGWISLLPRDPQESSLTSQFKSINSLALSFLYSPTLTSIHNYWKNHSLDWTDLYYPRRKSHAGLRSAGIIMTMWAGHQNQTGDPQN